MEKLACYYCFTLLEGDTFEVEGKEVCDDCYQRKLFFKEDDYEDMG